MAGEQDPQRPGATEPGGAADRAGALVRDQIASIANAAQAAADQIDQEAVEASSRAREQALGNAKAVHQGLSAIERELDDLLQLVASQTATLKRSIDRFDARSANAPAAAPRTEPAPPSAPTSSPVADAQPALTETVEGRAEEAPATGASAWAPEQTAGAPAPAAAAASAWAPPEENAVPAPPPEPAPSPEAAPAAQEPAAPPAPRTELEEEAWSRVKGKEPAELVALYETATGDRDDDGDEELDWGQYWSAVRQAVISEARARPELLVEAPDMSDLGRRQRKSRNKAYEALRDEVAATPA